MKYFLACREVLRRIASDLSIHFLDIPPSCQDGMGCLLERYWYLATHATPEYYADVWREIGIDVKTDRQ